MTQPKRLKSLRWLAFVLLGIVLFCGGGSFIALLVSKNSSARSLQEKLEQLSAKGIPVDDASLTALHEALTSTENVDIWIGVLDKLASKNFTDSCQNIPIVGSNENPIPRVGDPWADEAAAEQFLSQHADTMKQLLDVAQDNGYVRYPIEFKSFRTLLPYTTSTRIAARMLMLEAILAARAGDNSREFRAINSMFGCAISVRGEPCMSSQLVSLAIHGMAINRLQMAVEANRLSEAQLSILRARLAPFSDIKQSYTISLQGLLVSAIPAFRDPAGIDPKFARLSTLFVRCGIADRSARKYADRIEEALEIPTDNVQNFIADCQTWENQLSSGGMLQQMEDAISQQYSPALSSFGSALVRYKMMNDLATLAIAARQYEMANGQLPKNLEELNSQGIDLSLFHCVDGNLPLYLQVDSAKPDNPTSSSTDSSAPVGSTNPSRAILWSFHPQKSSNNPNPSHSQTPPSKSDNQAGLAEETDLNWWRWDLQ